MTDPGLAVLEEVGSLKAESPFLPVLYHYHYSGQSCYLEAKETGWVKEMVSNKTRESTHSNLD